MCSYLFVCFVVMLLNASLLEGVCVCVHAQNFILRIKELTRVLFLKTINR